MNNPILYQENCGHCHRAPCICQKATGPIEFEVTETARMKLFSLNPCAAIGINQGHPTTPSEFDIVARERGYENINDATIRSVLTLLIKQQAPDLSEPTSLDTLRRIIAERNSAIQGREEILEAFDKTVADSSCTCSIDGVTYRGNEETIGKLKELSALTFDVDCGRYIGSEETINKMKELAEPCSGHICTRQANSIISDLKRQLAEAKEQLTNASAVPEKWRNAAERMFRRAAHGAENMFDATHCMLSIAERGHGSRIARDCCEAGIEHALNWLAAELDKGTP